MKTAPKVLRHWT